MFFLKSHLRIIAQIKMTSQNMKRQCRVLQLVREFTFNSHYARVAETNTALSQGKFCRASISLFSKISRNITYSLILLSEQKSNPVFLRHQFFTSFKMIYKVAGFLLFYHRDFCILTAADLLMHHRK